jgi:hypothetical protein
MTELSVVSGICGTAMFTSPSHQSSPVIQRGRGIWLAQLRPAASAHASEPAHASVKARRAAATASPAVKRTAGAVGSGARGAGRAARGPACRRICAG